MFKHPLVRLLLILAGVAVLVGGVAADPTRFIETILSIPEVVVNAIPKMVVSMIILLGIAEAASRLLTGKSLRTHRGDNNPLFEYILIAAIVIASALALNAI